MSHLFCFGLGYSARAIARQAAAEGWTITGTSTTPDGAARIRAMGYDGLVYDGSAPGEEVGARLRGATHVVASAAPDASGDPVLRHHAADLAGATSVKWIGYLSTVGVYGDRQGGWVEETSDLRPVSQRSRQRVAAETEWLAFAARAGKTVQVFRLSGIYGPGRSAIDNLREGSARRLVKPGQVFNRIHVEDIAGAVWAAMTRGGTHQIYNVTDDEPAPPQDVVAYAATLLGLPIPPEIPFDTADLSPMARSFYGENKRVSNARLKADLGVTFKYPTYREGMAALAKIPA